VTECVSTTPPATGGTAGGGGTEGNEGVIACPGSGGVETPDGIGVPGCDGGEAGNGVLGPLLADGVFTVTGDPLPAVAFACGTRADGFGPVGPVGTNVTAAPRINSATTSRTVPTM
jgi:hypothetical protein